MLQVPLEEMSAIPPVQALKHPKWAMGDKISIDSATMMNKGLECIEAAVLFHLNPDQIDVLVHPQAKIHAFIQFRDGSQLAHLSPTDMKVPIAAALAFPLRLESGIEPLALETIGDWSFERPDVQRFPCLQLAQDALQEGRDRPLVINAANEVLVNAYLSGRIALTEIAVGIATTLSKHAAQPLSDLESIKERHKEIVRDTQQMLDRL